MYSEYNGATTVDDAKGKFASDILASLTALGTDDAHQKVLADIVVTKGDFIHLDLTKANTGPQGGTNPEAAYPNVRRLADDTIDIIMTAINNGSPLGDSVNASDVPPQDTFPFFALPHQPLENNNGVTVDDQTRN